MRPLAITAAVTGTLILLAVAVAVWSTSAQLVLLGPWRASTTACILAGLASCAAGILALQILVGGRGFLRLLSLPIALFAAVGVAGSAFVWAFTLTDITYLAGDRALVAERRCWHHCSIAVYEPAGTGYHFIGSLPLDAYDPFFDGAYRVDGSTLHFATAPGGALTGSLPLEPSPTPTASLR